MLPKELIYKLGFVTLNVYALSLYIRRESKVDVTCYNKLWLLEKPFYVVTILINKNVAII